MGDPVVIDGTFTKVPDASWEDRLRAAKASFVRRSIPAYIEFCQEVHAFREHCDSTQGGSEFSARGCEWLGCSTSALHQWDAVGRRTHELSAVAESLPPSERAIAQIASLGDEQFQKALPRLSSDMTQADVRELVKELNAKPASTPDDEDASARRARERLYKGFEGLPEKHQFVFASAVLTYAKSKEWEL